MLGVFIAAPWLALLPAVLFLVLYRRSGSRLSAVTAGMWLAYAIYEYAMYRRWWCSGECNIRVDLLLVYPVLLLLSVAALIGALVARHRAGTTPGA